MICERCKSLLENVYGSGRFCSRGCANSRIKNREITNKKIAASLISNKSSYFRTIQVPWNKGKKYEKGSVRRPVWLFTDDVSIKRSTSMKSYYAKKRIERLNTATDRKSYYILASFKFNVYDYPELFDLSLIEKYGWYHPVTNPNGVCRDHIFPIAKGFKLGIDPEVLGSLENCQLLLAKDNQKKRDRVNIVK